MKQRLVSPPLRCYGERTRSTSAANSPTGLSKGNEQLALTDAFYRLAHVHALRRMVLGEAEFYSGRLQHLQAKGALPPPSDLLHATRASPTSDWFA